MLCLRLSLDRPARAFAARWSGSGCRCMPSERVGLARARSSTGWRGYQRQHPVSGGVVARRDAPAASSSWCWLWVLVLAALARPRWIELAAASRAADARPALVLVDLSGSMDTKDFVDASGKHGRPAFMAVKQVLGDFLSRRKGDRVGVVVFGDAPFALVPFTTDLDLCRADAAATRPSAWPGRARPSATRSASASGCSPSSTVTAKTIIALTDGNDTLSKVPPAEAAGVARRTRVSSSTPWRSGIPGRPARTSSTKRR
jgi:Ca-activated chloride channel family protein